MKNITQSRLVELLSYDKETGIFRWKTSPNRRIVVGSIAGHSQANERQKGRVTIHLDGTRWFAHRLAWLYFYGVEPLKLIDHINGIRDDNRVCNLREATLAENQANSKMRAYNTSGFRGITQHKINGRWRAAASVLGKNRHLGFYATPEEAAAAYDRFITAQRGQFAQVNRNALTTQPKE